MSKIDYQDLSAKIMDNIGGVKNVKTVTHCVTRLRFYLLWISVPTVNCILP